VRVEQETQGKSYSKGKYYSLDLEIAWSGGRPSLPIRLERGTNQQCCLRSSDKPATVANQHC
jgi:hypothetical protein